MRWLQPISDLLSSDQTLSLQVRLFRLICATVAILCVAVVLPANALLNLPFLIDCAVLVLGLLAAYCLWASRKGRHHMLVFFLVLLALLNPIWFLNAGSDGSITFYFLPAVLYPIALFRGRQRWFLTVLLIANLCGLYFVEHLLPALVVPFQQPTDRLLDLITGVVCSFLALVAVAWLIVTTYDREQQRLSAAAEKLAASERNYREIFNATNEAIFLHESSTGRILDVNDTMLRMYGFDSKEQVLATSIVDLSGNDFSSALKEVRQRIKNANEQGPQIFEWLARKKSGEKFWVEVSLRSSQVGGQGRILAVARDITERKQAEVSMRESEEQFRRLFENSMMGIYRTTPDGRILLANSALVNMLRYGSFEELARLNLELDKFHPNYPRRLFKEMIAREGVVRGLESVWTRADGTSVYIRESAQAVFDSEGRLLCHDGVVEDISERKLAEKALLESEERFRQISMASSDFLYSCVYDDVGEYALDWLAGAVERITGCSPAELMARRCWRFLVLEEDMPKFQSYVIGLRGGETGNCELRLRREDGSVIWVASSAHCMGSPSRQQLRGALKDITERKRSEEEREKLQGQLTQAQKMESVGRLAGGVAHDFNNMLTAIQVNATMMLRDLENDSPWRSNIEEIHQCAQRSAALTQQLLAFARKQTIVPEVLDLNLRVEGILKMLRRLIGEDINLEWRSSKGLWPVKVDPSQVDQVLANLCLNSRDAIKGVGEIVLKTSNTVIDKSFCDAHPGVVAGDYVQLAASDNGCGMDMDVQRHLFEPFFTTKDVGQGSGLGLATVYGIVKQNEGFIDVTSELGKGTTFRIYLPRYQGPVTQAGNATRVQSADRGHETILMVEDEAAILSAGSKALEGMGYTVLAAGTPEEAIKIAEQNNGRIQLLLTDVIMPGMNGRDLAKRLQSHSPQLKCLFMSGYPADVLAPHGVLEESIHFIEKPFSLDELSIKLRSVLDEETRGSS